MKTSREIRIIAVVSGGKWLEICFRLRFCLLILINMNVRFQICVVFE